MKEINKQEILSIIKEERKTKIKKQLKILAEGIFFIVFLLSLFTLSVFMTYLLPRVLEIVGYKFGFIFSLGIVGIVTIPIMLYFYKKELFGIE